MFILLHYRLFLSFWNIFENIFREPELKRKIGDVWKISSPRFILKQRILSGYAISTLMLFLQDLIKKIYSALAGV